jgi:hypothetical protein
MPRRLNSESFFSLNVRSGFNQKAWVQIQPSNLDRAPAVVTSNTAGRLLRVAAILMALTATIPEAVAQTQSQSPPAASNAAAPQAASGSSGAEAKTAPAAATTAPAQSTPAPSTPAPATTSSATSSGVSTKPATPVTPATASVSAEQLAAAAAALAAGQQAYAKGDYQTAEQQFETAFAAVPSAKAQHGIAASLDLQAKPTEAYDAYNALLARPDIDELPASDITHARERAEVLADIPAVVRIAVVSKDQLVSGAKVLLDGQEQTTSEMRVKAGAHTLQVLATGYQDYEQTLTVKPAQILDLPVELQAVPAPAPAPGPAEAPAPATPPPAELETSSKVPAYVTLGVAGAAAITGTVFGFKALSAEDRYDKSPTVRNADNVERNALIADMAFGVAFTLGITGVVLLLTDEPTEPGATPEAQAALQVVPFVSKDRGGAVARFNF